MDANKHFENELEVIISKTVDKAQLGTLVSHRYGTQSSISCLAPYVKSREDIEVLLRNRDSLEADQPIELCGISLHRILRRVVSLEDELGIANSADSYVEFTKAHPMLVSFPPETAWLARKSATNAMRDCIADTAQTLHRDWSEEQSLELGLKIQGLAIQHRKSYGFWKAIMKEVHDGNVLSRHIIEWTIAVANRARAKYLAGMTPVIDSRTPGSLSLSDRFNRAYLRARAESSRSALMPHYLYTVNLSPFAIRRDKWTDFLAKLLRITRAELATGEFDGIHLSIRNLKSISRSVARVRTAKLLVSRLADVARDFRVPMYWSRGYVAGLVGMDEGVTVSSFPLNLNTDDMFLDGGPQGEDAEEFHYGSVLNLWKKESLRMEQIKASARSLPDLGAGLTSPTIEQLESSTAYRIGFSKPYNLRCLCALSKQWQKHILNNDVRPGKEYVQSFELPWCNWGV